LIVTFGFLSVPLLFAFIVAINIGGNIIPQGVACDIKRLFKMGALFALIHTGIAIISLLILGLIFG